MCTCGGAKYTWGRGYVYLGEGLRVPGGQEGHGLSVPWGGGG